ncbi:MAG: 1-(5-phosphoribosyl)-5-[(5-phosphoribosylamino)methylideneamino] imidazole-4-carboxamide isomerase [Boseongicola sp.]|nr:MAG: 1-(5-phosphoribosyl)-5-[(5-phosphoribosylamino)methylideneamino] imidazole-4-carboxamide isomerase [Boseongicola sp.]
MIIYPTIELQNGKCVSLNRGVIEDPMIWHVDPVKIAGSFADSGAEWMHVTDLDAIDGSDGNSELVAKIIRTAGIPVQLGGGFRSRDQVEYWIDKGAGRIVVGSLATRDPQLVKALAKYYPDQIVLSVDVWRGQVMMDGWRRASAFTPESFIQAYANTPFAAIVVTDVDADVDNTDGSIGLITGIAESTRTPIIGSGFVRNVDDISRLQLLRSVSGVLIGRALFRKDVDLVEALAAATDRVERQAEFI